MEPDNPLLDDFILSLAQKRQPKVCFVPTASGDSDNYVARFYCAFGSSRCSPSHLPLFLGHLLELANFLCDQDVIYVGGGNTANMLAVWRVQAMDKALAAAWRKGVVLCGVSAGAMCWFEGSLTDSFGSRLAPLRDGLSFSQGGCSAPTGMASRGGGPLCIASSSGGFPPTIADDGVASHFVGTRLVVAVSSRPDTRAYRLRFVDRKLIETPIPTRYLGKS